MISVENPFIPFRPTSALADYYCESPTDHSPPVLHGSMRQPLLRPDTPSSLHSMSFDPFTSIVSQAEAAMTISFAAHATATRDRNIAAEVNAALNKETRQVSDGKSFYASTHLTTRSCFTITHRRAVEDEVLPAKTNVPQLAHKRRLPSFSLKQKEKPSLHPTVNIEEKKPERKRRATISGSAFKAKSLFQTAFVHNRSKSEPSEAKLPVTDERPGSEQEVEFDEEEEDEDEVARETRHVNASIAKNWQFTETVVTL